MSGNADFAEWKQNTLALMAKKDIGLVHYPVTENDLSRQQSCPVCQSTQLELLSDVRLEGGVTFFATSACKGCGFVFRSIYPSFSWFQARWQQISTLSGEVFNPDLEALRKKRYIAYRELVSPFLAEGARILDVGGGYGSGASAFAEAGYAAEILEPEDDRVDYATKKLGLVAHHAVLEDFAPSQKYDLVLWAHNLEHVDDPVGGVKKVVSMLVPDGMIYLEVPRQHAIDWSDSLFMAHKSNFEPEHVRSLMAREDMVPVREWYPCLNDVHEDYGGIYVHKDHSLAKDGRPPLADTPVSVSGKLDIIRDAYRAGMPCSLPDGADALHFQVPFINQFYTTIRYGQGHFVFDPEIAEIVFVSDAGQ